MDRAGQNRSRHSARRGHRKRLHRGHPRAGAARRAGICGGHLRHGAGNRRPQLPALGAGVILRKADALSDLAEVFPGPFDVIVSNPPYVPQSDLPAMHVNVREYEPHEALLVPDDDPLRFYRAIARRRTGGRSAPAAGSTSKFTNAFAEAMRRMLGEEGYTDTEVREDLNGKPRMTCSRLK